jgi:uncharacterized protein DUF5672/glycosyl transferase family 9 (putative heptosyltransferase)
VKTIKDVSLICIDCVNPGAAIASLKKSMSQCVFDEVLFFTDIDIIIEGVRVIKIKKIDSKDSYSNYLLKEAWEYISSKFVLVSQHDSWVLNGDLFDKRLYNYDYAGALWIENDGLANGNGGFSWRSLRLMKVVATDDHINATAPEDVAVCRVYRRYLEKNYDLKWAPDELCEKFSFECRTPIGKTFGFHGYFHEPYKPIVVIRRTAAFGDCIQVEPVLKHFYKKGYKVVFETLPQFESVFHNHYFPILFPRQIDPRALDTAIKFNLDLSYEVKPKQLHLKSYFEFCGVPEHEQILTNPQLNYFADSNIKIFKQKYVVIHIDKRETVNRNAQTAWWKITDELKKKGYLIIQIGKNEHVELDAVQMNTIAEPMLVYLISGCDLFIGVDSGPSHIAVATGRKCVLFFGSVNPEYIHADFTNIKVITNHKKDNPICSKPYCWHETIGTRGEDCIVDKFDPPCINYKSEDVITAINELI